MLLALLHTAIPRGLGLLAPLHTAALQLHTSRYYYRSLGASQNPARVTRKYGATRRHAASSAHINMLLLSQVLSGRQTAKLLLAL
jgi:hypothetical protein